MTADTHVFTVDTIGRWSDTTEFEVTRERTVAYAAATNDDTDAHLAGMLAPPVFAVVPAFSSLAAAAVAAVPEELVMNILHGEQDIRIHRPIEPGDTLSSRAKLVGVHGRSSGVVVTTLAETRDARGMLINEQYFSGFFRAARWSGAQGQEMPHHRLPDAELARTPDAVVEQKFDADQTYRYAEASGDRMPIHTDEQLAKRMGLPGIIIHGLCTMAFASRAVIATACPDDPARLARLAVRFSSPSRPGQTITTRLWRSTVSHGRRAFGFDTTNDEGQVVIKDGLAEIAE